MVRFAIKNDAAGAVAQLVEHREFRSRVARYGGDARSREFSCWDRYLAMAFDQLTYRKSLRDVEAFLRSLGGSFITWVFAAVWHAPRLYVFTLCSAFFVLRTKENVLLQRRYSHPVDKKTGVQSDQIVIP